MGKGKKAVRRKDKFGNNAPRNVVTIERVLGSANFGESHDAESVHVQPSIRPAQLPARDPDFSGRLREVDSLRQELRNGGAIALFGKPGVGKTALAIELAHELAPTFPDAQLYVNLNGASGTSVDVERVLESLLRALGFSGDDIAQSFDEKISQYRSVLYGRRCIVVVDNAANESQVRQLLPGSPSCVMVVTSRQSLGGLAGVRRHRMETLSPSDSIGLLSAVSGEARVEGELSAAKHISELCGGLPLALRITANRLRDRPTWSLAYYAGKLKDERRRLELLRFGDAEVRASFALSYTELEASEQAIFRALGVIPASGFGEQLVSHLFGTDEIAAGLLLERLVERSLLEPAPHPGRYQMHDLIRVFALERLEEEDGPDVVSQLISNLVLWYGAMADMADQAIFGADKKPADVEFASAEDATNWLESEHLALVDVVRLAYDKEMHHAVLQIASSLSLFFERRLHGNSWRKVCDYALDSARTLGTKEAIIGAILDFARMSDKFPSPEDAILGLLDEAYELAKTLGSRRHEAAVLYRLGSAAYDRENYVEAKQILSTSATLAKKSRSYHTEGNALLALSDAHSALCEYTDAESTCERARLMFLMHGDRHCQGNAWRRLGELHREQENLSRATECFAVAIRQYESVHDVHCSGGARLGAARVLLSSGDLIRARIYCEQAYDQFVSIGDPNCEYSALRMLASLDRNAGDYESAIARYRKAGALLKSHGFGRALAINLKALGETVREHAGAEAAAPYFEEAMAAARGVAEEIVRDLLDSSRSD
ncbi:ATP-binding protein [Streptomyces sp. NPDC048720]|uniref:ATP-binding protein n=1 Tax=Streptomyces sp. NPDC048720 TaxID=3365588 RepID=UPI00371F494E